MNYTLLRKLISCLLYFIFFLSATSQTNKLDSLEQLLSTMEIDNEEKCDVLIKLSMLYTYSDSTKSLKYGIEALDIAQKIKSNDYEIQANMRLGGFYQGYDKNYLGYVYYKNAEKIINKEVDSERLCGICYNLMHLFHKIGDFNNAAYYAEKVLTILSDWYDLETLMPYDTAFIAKYYPLPTLAFAAQFMKGRIEHHDDNQETLDFLKNMFQKTIELNIQQNYPFFVGTQAVILCFEMNNPSDALFFLHNLRETIETGGIESPDIYIYLARAYAELNKNDSAEYYLKKVQDPHIFLYDDEHRAIFRTLATIAQNKEDFQYALDNFLKFHHLNDSIYTEVKSTEMARMKNWQALEQKDVENQILQQEQIKQKKLITILTIALPLIIILLIISIIIYRKSIEKNNELKKMHSVKDKLFTIVSHDLRSPINSLANTLKLANTLTINTENKARILKDVSTRVDNAYGLIDNLLIWSKNQMKTIEPTPENFDIQENITSIVTDLQDIADDKKIGFEINVQNSQIYIDKDMFMIIMRNLISNAIKYSYSNGKITINSDSTDNNIIISVKDTGVGMTQNVQNTLFNLSETKSILGTDNETGTGLGLVLCADFVQKNGGKIWVKSKENDGTTVFVTFPCE